MTINEAINLARQYTHHWRAFQRLSEFITLASQYAAMAPQYEREKARLEGDAAVLLNEFNRWKEHMNDEQAQVRQRWQEEIAQHQASVEEQKASAEAELDRLTQALLKLRADVERERRDVETQMQALRQAQASEEARLNTLRGEWEALRSRIVG
jgi:chromosome segregation ATPase